MEPKLNAYIIRLVAMGDTLESAIQQWNEIKKKQKEAEKALELDALNSLLTTTTPAS